MDQLWVEYNDQTTKMRDLSSEERKNTERDRIVQECYNNMQSSEFYQSEKRDD